MIADCEAKIFELHAFCVPYFFYGIGGMGCELFKKAVREVN